MSIISELMKLIVGVRFHPTEEELVKDYLKPKNRGGGSQLCVIPEVDDVCDYEPWELPHIFASKSVIKSNDQEWFFFSPLYFKYPNSDRVNRTTKSKSGFWKPTGKDREIMPNVNMKILVFHTGRCRNGVKTNWVIHEYHQTDQMPFVLCHLKENADVKNKKKAGEKAKGTTSDVVEPSSYNASDFENSVPESTILELPINNQQEPSVEDFSFSNAHSNDHNGMQSQFDIAEEGLTFDLLIAKLFPSGDIDSSISVGDINSPINNQKEPSVVGFQSANACSDDVCNEMPSQFGTTEQEEDTIPEFPVNKKRKLGLPPANACNDDFNGMPFQFGTTEQEEDLTEYCEGIISLDDLENSVSEHTIPEFSVNKKRKLGLPPANACNDDFNGISLDDLENAVSEHTIPEPQINNQKEPSVVGFPSANSCSDNCNQMQSQFVTTKQEEDDAEFWKEIYLKLDKYSREEMMQCISNDSSTLEPLGKVDNGDGEISSATHSGTAQARFEQSWELQLCGYSSNKESQWLERGGSNAKKGLKLTMDGSAGNCYPGSCTIWDLALDFIKKVWRLFHLSNFSLVGYFMDSLVLVVLLYYPIA